MATDLSRMGVADSCALCVWSYLPAQPAFDAGDHRPLLLWVV